MIIRYGFLCVRYVCDNIIGSLLVLLKARPQKTVQVVSFTYQIGRNSLKSPDSEK
jgi:hypothetical protein